jgi:2-keto-3-deoxy-L-rhamnonate aldolase RhmA
MMAGGLTLWHHDSSEEGTLAVPESLKSRLQSGEKAIGCWLSLFDSQAAEIVAEVGYDCVVIDMEHGAGGYLDAIPLLQAIRACGCTGLARVEANDPVPIKRALDIGVAGLVIPSIHSAQEARAAVSACRYPPEGIRGNAAGGIRGARYGLDAQAYQERINEELLVILQIESREGLEAVEEIAAVPGCDMLFIGPSDLSSTMEHRGDPGHPEVVEAIGRIERAAKAAGKLLGSILQRGRDASGMAKDGYDLIVPDSDVTLLRRAGLETVERFRAG